MSENVKKAYAVVVYEQISDETKLKNYMDIAPKTFGKFGAKFLTRGYPAVVKENGKNERTIIVEFPSVAKAEEFYDSPEYVVALDAVIVGMAINANIPSVKFKTASMVATEPKIMAAA